MGRIILLIGIIICFSLRVIDGCQLEGVTPGITRVTVEIWDYQRGDVYEHQIISITGVADIVQSGVNAGPYLSGRIEGTTFYLATTANYDRYEEVETLDTFTLTAQFRCMDGSAITQVFQIDVKDTNNNWPTFQPADRYDIAIATPLLPGHQITGCQHNIVVRDIDLTTTRIDFALTGSELFEIEYDEASSTTAKEFVAILKTTTFIRTLPEPVELTISATDVDETGDPPKTSYATVRITTDSNAEFPEEPVFSQPLYTARYTDEDTIILDESIYLEQGYHELVEFSLNEEYSSYIEIIRNPVLPYNLFLNVTAPLSADILTRQQIYLVIRADREFTSGATATIVVHLPEDISLKFEQTIYEGSIEDNVLEPPNIRLTQGYEGTNVNLSVSNDYFSATIQNDNEIVLTMQPLSQEIIDGNTYLNLEVVARTDSSSATAIVSLEIIKNDTITPLFQNPVYIGSYNTDVGLSLEQIELIQGYDNTVEVALGGEYSDLFELDRNGASSTLSVRGTLPLVELGEQTIILTIHAKKVRTVGAAASIYISLPEEITLAFESESYEGTITENILEVPNIILIQGYENLTVSVNVSSEFFAATIQDNNVLLLTIEQLPVDIIETNSFLNVIVTASTSRSSASTVVTLEIIKNDTTTPIFERALYSGTYAENGGLTLEQINIIQGYDESVQVTLNGEYSNLFRLIRNGAASNLAVDTIPSAIFNERNIALTVSATKPRTVGSTAVINIALPTDRLLEFEEFSYIGTYRNGNLTVEDLNLITGYDDTVNFNINGDYRQYFRVTNDLNKVSIEMTEPLPNSVVLENTFLQLTVIASGINALTATASLAIEIIKDDVTTPIFSQNVYLISYADENIEMNSINLIQGFDSSVSFRLDGDDSQYFSYTEVNNGIILSLQNAIPEEVIFNQKTLVFSVLAEKPLTVGAHATIVITFPTELTDATVMRFSQNTYVGSLDDGVLTLDQIILDKGFEQGTEFLLTGEYSAYFTPIPSNEIVTITTSNTMLPQEVIESNKFIILEIEARRNRAVSVFTSVVIELIHEEKIVEIPVFSAAYYRGSYDVEEELQIDDQIRLVQGFDNTVSFALHGEFSEYFSVTGDNNDVILSASEVPESVWENNHQLILTLVAIKPEVTNGSSAIIIDMPKDVDENMTILGFERSSYIGSIENDIVTIQPIVLTEGYTDDVVFTLIGDLERFFTYSQDGASIILRLINTLPEESIPSSGTIVLGVQASTTANTLPAVTTVILDVIRNETSQDVETLVFGQTYYVGTYHTESGVTLDSPISLTDGYIDGVLFTLDGDSSVYFAIAQDGNSATLNVSEAIPPAVVANNNQLIFVVHAQSPGGATAQATVVILLPNEGGESTTILGFERSSYIGSIENDIVTIQPIVLTEGYTDDVVFTLIGDLERFFTYSQDGASITLRLVSTLPEESIPSSGTIVLGVQASTTANSLPAVTTVILEVIRNETSPDVETLVFGQTYYVGTYHAESGVTLDSPISLTDGYIDGVLFTLDGDSSVYFAIAQDGNSATLNVSEAIPPAVVANNNQLIFVVHAQSPGGATAQATVVILLPNEGGESTTILGFERSSYIGSIENDIVTIQPIVLTEGYTDDVVFTLIGDLERFFTYSQDGASITLRLVSTLPEESIPSSGTIVLGVQASTTANSLPAVTTVILEVIRNETSPDVETLVFGQTYYVGTYHAESGVTLDSPISLTDGYIDGVLFTLDGDSSVYFAIAQDGNSATLNVSEAIPPAVVANNNQLIFVVHAQSPGGATAQATVVILLPNEGGESTTILGFERSSYIGSIENDIVTIQPIVLTEGYTDDVVFTLIGDLERFFTYSQDGASITLRLVSTLPEESIPSSGTIVLGVQASTTANSLPAVTTVILEVIRNETSPDVETLVFGQTYYVGTYHAESGVILDSPISLTDGYIDGVLFTLDGDSSVYFAIAQDGNSATLNVSEAIPPAVVANNNQLIFVVHAQSPGGATAQATVVILLPNEGGESTTILGFERSSYIGSIENDIVTIQPIVLTEGYTDDVIFTLIGDLERFFTYSQDGASITLRLVSTLPEESIPSSGTIVLGVQASTTANSLPAVTTVILEVIRNETSPDVEILVFGQTYYVGTYHAESGVTLDSPITLTDGYIDGVLFTLDGDSSVYFAITQDGNSATLNVSEAIPPAVVANNNQLIFVVHAQSPGGATAQATVVILLPNEGGESTTILGFERSSYIGSIENDIVTIQSIVLTEGYTDDVIFTLIGDLERFFTYSQDGASITLRLVSTLPEESIPSSGTIVLGVQASTTANSLPAVTTVILEVIRNETSPDVETLVFGQTYYVGTYHAESGVTLDSPITLTDGYIDGVLFTLDGDSSVYFAITQDGNSATLNVSEAIPPAVVANNNQLIFVVHAQSPGGATAQATVVILLPNEGGESTTILGFERSSYIGSIENDIVTIQPIVLTEGYTDDVVFTLIGDLERFFTYSQDGASITLRLVSTLPEESIPSSGTIVLGVQASTTANSLPAVTTVILEVIRNETSPDVETLVFGQTYYVGTYHAESGVTLDSPISLTDGYIDGVLFTLDGDSSVYFAIAQDENSATLNVSEAIPPAVVANNNQLIFVVYAQSPGGATAQATVVILLPNEGGETTTILGFERSSYIGSIENDIVTIQPIVLTEGYTDDVVFTLIGDLERFFTYSQDGASITLRLVSTLPEESIPSSGTIVLGVQASTTANSLPAVTTVILEVIRNETSPDVVTLVFGQTYYVGTYHAESGVTLDSRISLTDGYIDGVLFTLDGDSSVYFAIAQVGNSATLNVSEAIPPAVVANNNQLIFVVHAQSPGGATAQATVVILLPNEGGESTTILGFERSSYIGSIENDIVTIQPIVLTEGYTDDVVFTLIGDLERFFTYSQDGASITLRLVSTLPEESIPSSGTIVLGVQASATANSLPAVTTVILEVIRNETSQDVETLVFGQTYYVGTYHAESGVTLDSPISLTDGYIDGVLFTLDGDSSVYFAIAQDENSATLNVSEAIPPAVVANNNQLIFVVHAQSPGGATAQATVVILLPNGDSTVTFSKVLYEGLVQADRVQHEIITVTGHNESIVEIKGEYAELFTANLVEGMVTVERTGSVTLPSDVTYIAIEIHVQDAAAVLLLEIIHSETPSPPPSVTFSSPSYVIRVEAQQTGVVGRVTATADNGESLSYSLVIDDAHLSARTTVNNDGELLVSSPIDAGEYSFQVVATTLITQTPGEATVHLTVDESGIILPPLIVLDRDEEQEEYTNLVVFNGTVGCSYILHNKFPVNQNWLYVDETGLHARRIDREDPSIAFMALSQVQVEIEVQCNSATRNKISTPDQESRLEWLGPYDYGTSTWILGESIGYDRTRTVVNLIVNDINDNSPRFVGVENEPIAVGYPVPELEDVVLPRALVQLQATDADVGENAALIYWSAEPALAVSPTSGSVHVRDDVTLEEDQDLVVHATDRNGLGSSGAISLVVKLLDASKIAVVTVRNAFLEDESYIIGNLSNSVGHEVKVLRASVISDETEGDIVTRKKRQTSGSGASLQLYVYGLIEKEPVAANTLIDNINNVATGVVSIADSISLEDHLQARQIPSGRDIGLLVATIVLSVLLFILIVAILVWFFLKWWKNRKYIDFSDESSLESRNESIVQPPKVDVRPPRINIDDLKRSERRLQEMIDAPFNEADIPTPSNIAIVSEPPVESIVDITQPDPNILVPIVIKDKLKDADDNLSDIDEFGEVRRPRRKSVVTFNENVEKIFHLDDNVESSSTSSDVEVFRF